MSKSFSTPICYTAVYDEIEQQILTTTIQPSFASINQRASFPQVYFGDFGPSSEVEIDGLNGAQIVADRINAKLLSIRHRLNEMSTWELENTLSHILSTPNEKGHTFGWWTSRQHPLSEIVRNRKELPPQRRSARKPPKKHLVLDRVQKKLDDAKNLGDDAQKRVSKPYQEHVTPLRSFLEHNLSSSSTLSNSVEQLAYKRAEREFNKLLENAKREVEEELRRESEIEESENEKLENIGNLSLLKGKALCQWAKDKYNIRVLQVTVAPIKGTDEYPMMISSTALPKVKKSVRAKLLTLRKTKTTTVKVEPTKRKPEEDLIDLMVKQERELRNAARKGKRFAR